MTEKFKNNIGIEIIQSPHLPVQIPNIRNNTYGTKRG